MALNGAFADLSQAQIMEAPGAAMSDAELGSAIAILVQHLHAIHKRLNLLEYEQGKRQRFQGQQALDGM